MGKESSRGCVRSRVRIVVRVVVESMSLACRAIVVTKDEREEGQDPIVGCWLLVVVDLKGWRPKLPLDKVVEHVRVLIGGHCR